MSARSEALNILYRIMHDDGYASLIMRESKIIQAGTGEVCLVFFNRRIFLGDDLRAAIIFRHEELFLNESQKFRRFTICFRILADAPQIILF